MKSEMKEAESEMKEVEWDVTDQQAEKTKENKGDVKPKKSREFISEIYSSSIYDPPIFFSKRLKKSKTDNQFSKFLSIFKQLHINIPLIEALEQMPKLQRFWRIYYQTNGSWRSIRL